ncbi:integrin alpha-8-like [Rhopilema esculentum]|uniref:integrin alpha-8-like n=1 Tax=Rhopilema esculentum TaxID=499914 RepID=UPI0031D8CBF7
MAVLPIRFIFLSCIFIGICNCFNVEVKSAKSFSGAGGEYFGFTVAFHKAENAYWALVGAPMSNQTGSNIQEKNGAVYRCPISGSSCINMAIDDGTPAFDEIKTGQWMGASLYSMGADQGIIACAPRFIDKPHGSVWLHGRCGFVDGKTFQAGTTFWNPCEFHRNQGNTAFGYCETGFSLAYSSGFVAVGIPGVMQVQGRLAVQYLSNILGGSINFLPTSGDRLDLGDTMGFSISWGNFSGSKHGDIVGGAPNGSNRKGKVLIYSLHGQLPIFAVIENTDTTMAIGSYFGSVVCGVDLTNDGISDLVVGAPFYSAVSDEGKVYVYTTSSQSGVTLKGSMLGDRTPGAKFGSSIASAGDLNNDKYNDLVVGAPYGGPDGKGAIYIYHGSANGIGNGYEPVQKIYASTLGGMPATFGFSVAGGMDVDVNGFPDLVIGSFGADKIHIFKSKPVLKTTATLKTDKAKISLSKNATSICKTDGAINYQCIEMTFCMTVSGKGISGAIDMDVKFEFDKDQLAGKRAIVEVSGTKQASKQLVITYNANVEKCTKEKVFIQTNANNILRPIVFAASYGYKEPSGGCGASPCPIADLYETRALTTQVTYVKDCGSDDICNTDLAVTCQPKFSGGQTSLVFGLEKSFSLQIDATNKGENAFLAKMKVDFPDDLTAVGVEFINEQNPLWERLPTKNGKSSIDFNLDSPFEKNRKLEIVIKFTIAKERPSGKTLEFKIEASSVSNELTPNDNIAIVKVETGLLADITISGSASPENFFYDKEAIAATSDLKNETQVGPVVEYTFFVSVVAFCSL